MPAAAVIPAPVAYIKVVAVKKLVVRIRVCGRSRGPGAAVPPKSFGGRLFAFPALSAGVDGRFSSRVVALGSLLGLMAVSPPRVLLTECPRRPVRSL